MPASTPSPRIRAVTLTYVWFFVVLSGLALLSPVGQAHDELFHLSSIWCSHGERDPYCTNSALDSATGVRSVQTNIPAVVCQLPPDRPLVCPVGESKGVLLQTNNGLYPPVFYWTMGLMVNPSVELSVVLIRVLNALTVTSLLCLAAILLPARHRRALYLTSLSTFVPFGLYLFSSANPSSWTIAGVLVTPLALHAAMSDTEVRLKHRVQLLVLSGVGALMASGSRWDAVPYLAVAVVVIGFDARWQSMRQRSWTALATLSVAIVAGVLFIERITPFSIIEQLGSVTRYSSGQPDNLAFMSHYVLHAVPKAIELLGEVPTMSGIFLPRLVSILGFLTLSALLGSTFNRQRVIQSGSALLLVAAIAFVLMSHSQAMDERDPFGPSTRYVMPLFLFAVAWWSVHAPAESELLVDRHLRWIPVVATMSFGLSVFTIAERSVDSQTFGLRPLPEGLDHWWWTGLPVGVNFVVFATTFAAWRYHRQMCALINTKRVAIAR